MSDPLLQPFRIRDLTLKNRIVSTSHEPAYADHNGFPGERYVAYHVEKARGGVGLTMIGGSANVDIDSPAVFGNLNLSVDEVVEPLRRLTDAVHAEGAAIMTQITHMGRRGSWDSGHWMPTLSSSPHREPWHRSVPKQMDLRDIARVVAAFGRTAARCEAGGLDGVEVCAHSGHLVDQFWSPRMNTRDDAYGGGFENRIRFAIEVMESIRSSTSEGFAVGIRMSGDEGVPGGLPFEESVRIGEELRRRGLVDFVSLVGGSATDDVEYAAHMPATGSPLGPYLDLCRAFRERVEIPLMHATRIADVQTARHALNSGAVDLVGMTRAMIADPHLVRKIEQGVEERIRPCVGASYCINRIHLGLDAVCIHNPATGRETTIPHVLRPAQAPKRVVVVGGGPAGLEAARAAAERGHRVTLLEADSVLGGQLAAAARASDARREMLNIVGWLEAECGHLGVEVRRNVFAEAEDVLELDPEVVVISTGGLPGTGTLAVGAELVVSGRDLLDGSARPGGTVLFSDEHGGEQALSVVEFLIGRGAQVEIVTPDRHVGQEVIGNISPRYLDLLYRAGAVRTPDTRLVEVSREGGRRRAVLENIYTLLREEREVDQVVVEAGTIPLDDLFFELAPRSSNDGETDLYALDRGGEQRIVRNESGEFQLFRIGDAVAHRNVHAAIFDARRLAMGI